MNKTLIITSLAALGFASFSQGVIAEEAAAPKVLLLKKAVPKPVVVAPTGEPMVAESALKAPAPVAKVRAQELPGLGMMPGEANNNRIKSVRVGADRNELVYISLGHLNKISTPFETPQMADATGATLKQIGQDLFIKPASDQPLTVYITDGNGGQSIGLTLVPQVNLPGQSIVLQPDAPTGTAAQKAEAEEIAAGDYVSRINAIVKSLALGKTPAGFTRSRLPTAVVTGKELVIEPQYKFAGSTYDLYSYRIRSISASPLELKEDAFYTDAVRAVAFYPSVLLQEGEDTTVFVIADRPVKGAQQ